jgi:hypothetical protein
MTAFNSCNFMNILEKKIFVIYVLQLGGYANSKDFCRIKCLIV